MSNSKRPDEQKREDRLFLHLQKSYAEYLNGSRHQLDKLVEEVCKRDKDSRQIELWVDLFNRLLLSLTKTNQDPKIIIDIVLFHLPWFTSPNHFKSLQSFQKFVFTLLPINPANIASIYRMLIAKLRFDLKPLKFIISDSSDNERIISKYETEVQINGRTFPRKTALNDEILGIIQRYNGLNEEDLVVLSESDQTFMMEVLKFHPNQADKFEDFKELAVGYYPQRKKTKCFYVIKKNGSSDDISYVKSVENLYDSIFRKKHIHDDQQDSDLFNKAIQITQEIDFVYKLQQSKLLDAIQEQFPHKSRSDFQIKVFVNNILQLCDKIPQIAPKVFRIIFQKLLSIDSEIKQPLHQRLIIKTPAYHPSDHKEEMQKKLDQLIYIILDYFSQRTNEMSQKREELNIQILKELLKLFQETILPNPNYKMVQFIYFYFCCLPGFSRFQQQFLTRLMLNITTEYSMVSKQQSSCSIFYLSSLLVRCRQIDPIIYRKTLNHLLTFSEGLLGEDQPNKKVENYELSLQLGQLFTYLLGVQLNILKESGLFGRVVNMIQEFQKKYSLLATFQFEILVRLNEVLLLMGPESQCQELIDTTASLITTHMGKKSEQTESNTSPSQQQFFEQESLFSKQTAWTFQSGFQVKKQHLKQLEFRQPFNQLTLIYSENFFKQHYKPDQEMICELGNNKAEISSPQKAKRRSRVQQPQEEPSIIKKTKKV